MTKEIIISIIIVISVIVVDFVSSNYTKQSRLEIEKCLKDLRYELEKEYPNETELENKIQFTNEKWKDKYEKLAFYIEHDELEKVETEIYGLNANIDTKEYNQAIEKIEKCKFILKHIEEKENLNFKNIFQMCII